MTDQTVYHFQQALRQIGLWADEQQTRQIIDELLRKHGLEMLPSKARAAE